MDRESFDHIIENSFKIEPGFSLPADFANKVTQALVRKEQWKIDLREYLFYSCIVLVLVALVSGFYIFIYKNNINDVVTYLKENWISVTTIALLLNFILFADKVLLRLMFNRWKLKS